MSHYLKLLIFLIYMSMGSFAYGADAHKNLKWKTQNVSVCWGDSDLLLKVFEPFFTISGEKIDVPLVNNKIRDRVKNLVQLHYSKEITGIHFIGWNSCLPMDRSVKLFYFDELGEVFERIDSAAFGFLSKLMDSYLGVSSIGNSAFADFEMQKPGQAGSQALILRTLNPGTILHEFGHLSGLRHEHIKPDVYHGEVCHHYREIVPASFKAKDEKKQGSQSLTIADDFSIMNYCYFKLWKVLNSIGNYDMTERMELPYPEYMTQKDNFFHYRTLLSLSDIHSLRCLYTKENKEHYCHYHNANQDRFSQRIYQKYLEKIISSESQNIYEY